jgi:pilus assembly protein Flp/PilA
MTEQQRARFTRILRALADVTLTRATMKLTSLLERLLAAFTSDEGQGMVEYALILVLIAVVVIVVLIVLGNQVQNVFCNISGGLGM